MGRLKGSRNKHRKDELLISKYTSEERLQVIANLIIDRIFEDQGKGKPIYKFLKRSRGNG